MASAKKVTKIELKEVKVSDGAELKLSEREAQTLRNIVGAFFDVYTGSSEIFSDIVSIRGALQSAGFKRKEGTSRLNIFNF